MYKILRGLQNTSNYVADLIHTAGNAKMMIREFGKAHVVEDVKRGTVIPIKVDGAQFADFVTFERAIKKVIDERIGEVRKKCWRITNSLIQPRAKRRNVNFSVLIMSQGPDRFGVKNVPEIAKTVHLQAECVHLAEIFETGDRTQIERFQRNAFLAGIFGTEIYGANGKPRFPLTFWNVHDYFERADILNFEKGRP